MYRPKIFEFWACFLLGGYQMSMLITNRIYIIQLT